VTVDRAARLGVSLAVGAAVAGASLAQLGLGFLRDVHRPRTSRLPPHADPNQVIKYSDAVLEPLRRRADPLPLTEAIIKKIATDGPMPPAVGQSVGVPDGGEAAQAQATQPGPQQSLPSIAAPADEITRVDAFFRRLLRVDQRYLVVDTLISEGYPTELRTWADEIRATAASADGASLRRAGEFFKENAFRISLILSTSSLLEAYACEKGVRVLAQTGYLSHKPNRRLAETLQFLLFVGEPEGFVPGRGHAIDAILKVRLMHAAIRWLIPRKMDWPELEVGVPVNEEDLLGMLTGFSGIVIRDLDVLGVELTAQQVVDYLYLWNLVGRLLGANGALLPADLSEALALISVVRRRHQRPSDEGAKMAAALVEFHASILRVTRPLGIWAMRLLAGDHVCDMVGVPYSKFRDVPGSRFVFDTMTVWGETLIGHKGLHVGLDYFLPPYVPRSLRDLFP